MLYLEILLKPKLHTWFLSYEFHIFKDSCVYISMFHSNPISLKYFWLPQLKFSFMNCYNNCYNNCNNCYHLTKNQTLHKVLFHSMVFSSSEPAYDIKAIFPLFFKWKSRQREGKELDVVAQILSDKEETSMSVYLGAKPKYFLNTSAISHTTYFGGINFSVAMPYHSSNLLGITT